MNRTPRSAAIARSPAWDIALSFGLVAAVFLTFGGALRYPFSQDDFWGLARALDIVPPLSGPWRFLSGQVYFDVMHALAGLDPRPYHLASALGHAACAVLLYFWIRRYCSRPAAWVGALFFAVHPAAYTELYWISAIGEIYARLFALVTLHLFFSQGAKRHLATVAFALSLLCKESTILLPVVVAALVMFEARRRGENPWRALRSGSLVALFGVAALYVPLVLAGASWGGLDTGGGANAAYAFGGGWHVIANLLTYAGWAVTILMPFVRTFGDKADAAMYVPGAVVILLATLGLFSKRLRDRGWAPALVAVVAMLLPVLGFSNHTYRYYLYTALTNFGWLVAIALDALMDAFRGTTPAAERRRAQAFVLAVSALSFVLLLNSVLLVRKVETMPFLTPNSRADATVDRALVAERVLEGLANCGANPPGSRMYFWSPARTAPGTPHDLPELYWERNVRTAMQDGLAARVRFPSLAEAKFLRDPLPPRPGDYYAVYDVDGSTRVVTAQVLDSLLSLSPAPRG